LQLQHETITPLLLVISVWAQSFGSDFETGEPSGLPLDCSREGSVVQQLILRNTKFEWSDRWLLSCRVLNGLGSFHSRVEGGAHIRGYWDWCVTRTIRSSMIVLWPQTEVLLGALLLLLFPSSHPRLSSQQPSALSSTPTHPLLLPSLLRQPPFQLLPLGLPRRPSLLSPRQQPSPHLSPHALKQALQVWPVCSQHPAILRRNDMGYSRVRARR